MSEEDGYFCEFDTEQNSNDDNEEEDNQYSQQADIYPPTPPGEEDIIYRMSRMQMTGEDEDFDYNLHEETFKKSSFDLIEIALSKTTSENKGINEGEYLAICSNLKKVFDCHKKMVKMLIRVNNDLKDEVDNCRKRLVTSMETHRKIHEELSCIKEQLSIVNYYDDVD